MLKSYRLLISLTMSIFSLCVCLVAVNAASDSLEQASGDITKKTENLKVTQISQQLNTLSKTTAPMNLPMPDKKQAGEIVISTAENMREIYGATVESDLADKNSAMTMRITFAVSPNAQGQVTQLTDFITTSTTPIMRINKIDFSNADPDKNRTLTYHITLVQPYIGGQYVY